MTGSTECIATASARTATAPIDIMDGADSGKTFVLTELSTAKAEIWAEETVAVLTASDDGGRLERPSQAPPP